MLNQNQLFRAHGLGSFSELLLNVTRDPAMLLWLSGSDNSKTSPNENYAREMMELFTLGAGRGYTESDVRQQARALTGFRNDWRSGVGDVNFRYDPTRHDPGLKTIFHRSGAFTWRDAVRLSVTHADHPRFFVRKLWSYFISGDPDPGTERALEHLYLASGHEVRPVVGAILKHPQLYDGGRLVKPPIVYTAGLLRRIGRPIDTTSWSWIGSMAGQQLSIRRTSRAGTTRAGSTPRPGADAGGRPRTCCGRTRSTRARRRSRTMPAPSSKARSPSGASPR